MAGRVVTIAAGAICLALAFAPAVAAQDAALEFVAPDNVALTSENDKSKPASVWIRNASAAPVTPEFAAYLEDSDGKPKTAQVVAVDENGKDTIAGPVDAHRVARYRLYVKGDAARTDTTGELEAHADRVAPAAIDLTVGPKKVNDRGVDGTLGLAFVAALLVTLVAAFTVRDLDIRRPLGTLNLDFKASFASTLTAGGALLTTVVAAGVLPAETKALSKEGYTALGLIFGVAIVMAGIVYSAFETTKWEEKEGDPGTCVRKMQGHGWSFLLACFITLWAVFGQLLVLSLLIDELGTGKGFSGTAVDVLKWMLLLVAGALILYTIRRVQAVFEAERPAGGGARVALRPPDDTPPPSVSLL